MIALDSSLTQRIKVLHIAHCDTVVAAVSHHFILDFLPAS